jgi:hypothetical protein
MLAAERGVAAAPRPSLYRAGDTGVEVKIEVTEANERRPARLELLLSAINP